MNYPEITRDLIRYRNQVKRFRNLNGFIYQLLLLGYFFKWRYLKKENDSVKFRLPWITLPSITYTKRFLKKDMRVFEYGCGGSTLFFADRVNEVVSVEHNQEWYVKIKKVLEENKADHVRLMHIEPVMQENEVDLYFSGNDDYTGLSFRNYVNVISEYPDKYFDLILIDGRARTACFMKSIAKLKDNGIIVWDNSERERYRTDETFQSPDFIKLEMPGPTPFSKDFTLTTIFKKYDRLI